MTPTFKKYAFLFLLILTRIPSFYSQQGFVELRKEITCFDNTRCISQEFNISLPLFDEREKGVLISTINDSIYRIAESVLAEMRSVLQIQQHTWKSEKAGIDSCESGINSTESRDLYYSILYNENNLLSFIIRSDWTVEKQMILKSDFETAGQQTIYCFLGDLESDKLIDVNTLFKSEDRSKIIEMIRQEYELEFEEEMQKAGDRLRYCGLLLTPLHLIAAYTMLLPNNESEVRTVELPRNEIYDYMQPGYQQLLKEHVQE